MKLYHGTSKENWEKIQKDGYLFGKRSEADRNKFGGPEYCNYLSKKKGMAQPYGGVMLVVEWAFGQVDDEDEPVDSYKKDSWQSMVYIPIPIKNIEKIEWNGC